MEQKVNVTKFIQLCLCHNSSALLGAPLGGLSGFRRIYPGLLFRKKEDILTGSARPVPTQKMWGIRF